MESQHQNPEFRINPENFHPCWNNSVKCSILKQIDSLLSRSAVAQLGSGSKEAL